MDEFLNIKGIWSREQAVCHDFWHQTKSLLQKDIEKDTFIFLTVLGYKTQS